MSHRPDLDRLWATLKLTEDDPSAHAAAKAKLRVAVSKRDPLAHFEGLIAGLIAKSTPTVPRADAIRKAAEAYPEAWAAYTKASTRLAHSGDTLDGEPFRHAAPPPITAPPGNDRASQIQQKIETEIAQFMARNPGVTRQAAMAEVFAHEPGRKLWNDYRRALVEPGT